MPSANSAGPAGLTVSTACRALRLPRTSGRLTALRLGTTMDRFISRYNVHKRAMPLLAVAARL